MRNKKLLGGAAAVLSASLLFTACGSRNEPGTGSTAAATDSRKVATNPSKSIHGDAGSHRLTTALTSSNTGKWMRNSE